MQKFSVLQEMKEQEKAKRLLQFTQRGSYNSDRERSSDEETVDDPLPPPSRSEAGELALLGIRSLDSQRYADQLVRDAGLLPEKSAAVPSVAEVVSAPVAVSGTAPNAGVIYSASAPGFTRSSRPGEAVVDVSNSRTAIERFDMEKEQHLAAGSGSQEEGEEDALTGNT